ncbi:arsenate reductase ArsC [Chitinivorax sp. PXF-14]|uniref:arsenate reductase ArsC n=1 Tax=Chitinivorax sp. PXF-14 TaxID=3230488 RepID=UPI0034650BE3
MSDKTYNVLFICTGNSARSILAEVIMNHLGRGQFQAYSAGSHPRGEVHPLTLETLRHYRHDIDSLRSKSWAEFAQPDAPKMDFIFTVCDNAAGEACPTWPGQPMTAHWGFTDPSQTEGETEDKLKAFSRTYMEIANRLRIFLSLPLEKIDRLSLQNQLRQLGSNR